MSQIQPEPRCCSAKSPQAGQATASVAVTAGSSSVSLSLAAAVSVATNDIHNVVQAHVLDSSMIRPAQLRSQIKDLVEADQTPLTLVFESFAFKRGIPMDADFVFDVRMLPNPHYEPELKPLTGCDEPVARYLAEQAEVQAMEQQIGAFLRHWLPQMLRDHRSYVTVAIGCTGGQHRSVYLVERLAQAFAADWATRLRHREIDGWPASARSAMP